MNVIFHIGVGKTGTSSIQTYLYRNLEALKQTGFFYAGTCFDTLGKDKDWKEISWGFNKLSAQELTREFIEEFNKYELFCQAHKLDTLIISNEAFSGTLQKIIPTLKKLNKKHTIKIVLYVRSPESWLISAYQQWEIKDKTSVGRIQSAEDFINSGKHKVMSSCIHLLRDNDLLDNLIIGNMDKAINDDVVNDFCEKLGIDFYGHERINDKLDDFEEAFFYLVNNRLKERVSPKIARKKLRKILMNNADKDFFEVVNVRKEYFDKEEMVTFRNYLNRFLENEQKFKTEYEPKDKTNKLDPKVISLINSYLDAIEILDCISADDLRDAAVALETDNINTSYRLMKAASKLRPNGPFIKKKLNDYEQTGENPRHDVTKRKGIARILNLFARLKLYLCLY